MNNMSFRKLFAVCSDKCTIHISAPSEEEAELVNVV
jgi:hypothetical protein